MFCTTQLPLIKRLRRNRKSSSIRALVEEHRLAASDLVAPFFLIPGEGRKEPIPNFPHIFRLSADLILKEAERLHALGLPAIALFPVIDKELKDAEGSYALNDEAPLFQAIALLKKELPELALITDIALDPFTSHGHDGLADDSGMILNDETVDILTKMAILHASYGVDIVAPSDMMDGRVRAIREGLDAHGHENTNILAYTVKYASSLYAPFRHALSSSLAFGDKKTYQMNPANVREALLEAKLDEEEGADALMVKPALLYLDVIAKIRAQTNLPVAAYHVSGEYAMAIAAEQLGYLDAKKVLYESLLSIKRAGADFILTYAAPLLIDLLN
jgi:porphobilinogen synthase